MSEMDNLLASLEADPAPAKPEAEPEASEATGDPQPEVAVTGSDDEPPKEATSLKSYAEAHELDIKELYALTLTGAMTLGEMGNAGKALKSLETDRETFETEQASFRLEQAATQKEVGDLVGLLKAGELTPDGMAKLQAMQGKALESEQRSLLTVLPEWKDTVQRSADVAAMTEHLGPFKLTEHDLAAVADHRWLKYIHFNMRRDARAAAALKGIEKPKPKGKGANSGKAPTGGAGINIEELVKGSS